MCCGEEVEDKMMQLVTYNGKLKIHPTAKSFSFRFFLSNRTSSYREHVPLFIHVFLNIK